MIYTRYVFNLLVFLAIFTPGTLVLADNENKNIYEYDHVASTLFWKSLYQGGGWTLYCGFRFDNNRKTTQGRIIDIEHIYPTNWMFRHLDCDNRLQCRDSGNMRFAQMEADLHNLYPVWQTLITHRYNFTYGEVNGEEWRFDDCDIEWKSGVTEPRPKARGNIARAMIYMHTKYNLPLTADTLQLLQSWNRQDPPSKQEMSRNDRIEKLQGQRNPYIDNPFLVDQIRITLNKD